MKHLGSRRRQEAGTHSCIGAAKDQPASCRRRLRMAAPRFARTTFATLNMHSQT